MLFICCCVFCMCGRVYGNVMHATSFRWVFNVLINECTANLELCVLQL